MADREYSTEEQDRRTSLSIDIARGMDTLKRYVDRYQSTGNLHNLEGAMKTVKGLSDLIYDEHKEVTGDDSNGG